VTALGAPTGPPVAAHARPDTVRSAVRDLDGRPVVWFEISGGPHHGAIGPRAARAVVQAVALARALHLPIVGVLDTSGAEIADGVAALHAWGQIAVELAAMSGTAPVVLVLDGACVSGPALLLGMADAVVMTARSFAYLSGPDSVAEFTGVEVGRDALGGAAVHATRTGVATWVVDDLDGAVEMVAALMSFLPGHHLEDPPRAWCDDPVERPTAAALAAVPDRPTASYDVLAVVDDVVDDGSVLELRAQYAPNLVTALARLDGRPVGVIANQPLTRAGTLDIEASRKAARFVAMCDTFNLPLLTFVDTPGFEPGRDLEWRGMIRHGAELVHAYCAATVPRLCVVLRKAYGGAYIVMDSRGVGNDFCVAWPTAQIAVMGAAGAVQILEGRRLRDLPSADAAVEAERLTAAYETEYLNPYRAVERGLVDAVIDPLETRSVLASALEVLATKRISVAARKHSNTPL
jgi:acetyl-CoA carboxylase carboxyltransferase component